MKRFVLPLVLAFAPLAGCVDQPVCIAPIGQTRTVTKLSELGFFQGAPADQIPTPDFTPYQVNVSLYADGASKLRFVHVPAGQKIESAADRWSLPDGTVVVKTFYYPNDARDVIKGRQLLETRFLVRTASGYTASTYVWNKEQTDATCSGGNLDLPTSFIDADGAAHVDYFHVPGTSLCQTCHDNRALGWRTRQLDQPGTFDDGAGNQIEHLVAAGLVDQPPTVRGGLADPFGSAPLDDRARAYLDANCGHCHASSGGEAASTGVWFALEDTVDDGPVCRRASESVNGATHVIFPGSPRESEFLQRMLSSDAFVRMPRGPSHIPDPAGIAVLNAWVSAMTPPGCP